MTVMKRPRGRPPKDPAKLRVYMERMKTNAPVRPDKPDETDAQILARLEYRFKLLRETVEAAARNTVRSLIVSGAPGTGKTHVTQEVLAYHSEKNGVKYIIISGYSTPISLYKTLWEYRHNNCVVVLDDADNVWGDEDGLNLLKAALDTGLTRTLSWRSETKALKDEDIPNTFTFHASMIFITNMDLQAIVDNGSGKMAAHYDAVISRSLYLDLKLHTRREVGLWVKHSVKTNRILEKDGLTRAQQDEALEWLIANRDGLRSMSIREALKVASFMKSDPKGWQRRAEEFLLRK